MGEGVAYSIFYIIKIRKERGREETCLEELLSTFGIRMLGSIFMGWLKGVQSNYCMLARHTYRDELDSFT